MHSARRTIVAAAVAAAGMVFGMGEAQAAPKSGVWGGQLAVLTLNEQGGRLEFGCGYATLAAPVTPDRKGRFKAVGFQALGYTAEEWETLRDDLLALARRSEAVPGQASIFGQKYEVSGTLRGPNGREAKFTCVWLVAIDGDAPRFITAFPG